MRILTHLTVAGQQVPVAGFEASQLAGTSLEERISIVSQPLRAYQIVACEVGLADFLAEEQNDERARLRRKILEATGELIPPAQILADSIEDVGIVVVSKKPKLFDDVDLSTLAMLLVPIAYLNHLDLSGGEFVSFRSTPWKENTVNVFELENRFAKNVDEWQFYDSSRLRSRRQGAGPVLAKALGIDEQLDRVERQYMYAHAIGEAVGREHINQWLAMDLKLEHFLPREGGGVWHVDHSNDVFLLRQATAEECAKSIAPLFQQMSYPQWHAFREGYWDARRRAALDVLSIFEGSRIGEILGCRAIANAVQARNEDDVERAVAWCEDAIAAFQAYQEIDEMAGWSYLIHVQLVQGDVYLYHERFTEALALYDRALVKLKERSDRGTPETCEMVSAMINSAAALEGLNRSEDARNQLLQAKRLAGSLPQDNQRVKFLVETASASLKRLKERRRKAT